MKIAVGAKREIGKHKAHALYRAIMSDCEIIGRIYDKADAKARPLFERVVRKIYVLSQNPKSLSEATGYDDVHELLRDGDIAPVLFRMKTASYMNRKNLLRLARLDAGAFRKAKLLQRENLPINPRTLRVLEELEYAEIPNDQKVERAVAVVERILPPSVQISNVENTITLNGNRVSLNGKHIATIVTGDPVLAARYVSMLVHLPGRWIPAEGPFTVFYDESGKDERREIVAEFVDEGDETMEFVRQRLRRKRD